VPEVAERLVQARAAAASGAWPQAYSLLSEIDGGQLTEPEELEMLGEVAWWTGREGLALLDEATVAAVSGELDPYTTAVVYCGIIAACRDLGDYARAGDWTEAAKRWCERQAISGFPGLCRVNRAEVMRLRGSWPEAEEEIHRSVDELHDFAPRSSVPSGSTGGRTASRRRSAPGSTPRRPSGRVAATSARASTKPLASALWPKRARSSRAGRPPISCPASRASGPEPWS